MTAHSHASRNLVFLRHYVRDKWLSVAIGAFVSFTVAILALEPDSGVNHPLGGIALRVLFIFAIVAFSLTAYPSPARARVIRNLPVSSATIGALIWMFALLVWPMVVGTMVLFACLLSRHSLEPAGYLALWTLSLCSQSAQSRSRPVRLSGCLLLLVLLGSIFVSQPGEFNAVSIPEYTLSAITFYFAFTAYRNRSNLVPRCMTLKPAHELTFVEQAQRSSGREPDDSPTAEVHEVVGRAISMAITFALIAAFAAILSLVRMNSSHEISLSWPGKDEFQIFTAIWLLLSAVVAVDAKVFRPDLLLVLRSLPISPVAMIGVLIMSLSTRVGVTGLISVLLACLLGFSVIEAATWVMAAAASGLLKIAILLRTNAKVEPYDSMREFLANSPAVVISIVTVVLVLKELQEVAILVAAASVLTAILSLYTVCRKSTKLRTANWARAQEG